jgi:hypothetical protein
LQRTLDEALAGLTDDERRTFAALAVVGKTTVPPEALARLAGVDRAAVAVSRLRSRGLVSDDDHAEESALGSLAYYVRHTESGIETGEKLLDALTTLARADGIGSNEIEAILGLSGWAAETGHWRRLLTLVQTAASTLAFLEHSRERVELLERGLEAARRLGDRDAETELRRALSRGASAGPGGSPRAEQSAFARAAARVGALALVGGVGFAVGYVVPHTAADSSETVQVKATVPVTITGQGSTITSLATVTDEKTVELPPTTVTETTTVVESPVP